MAGLPGAFADGPDVRDLGVDDARILSISRAGDMAVLIGAQNIVRVFGTPTLARVPLAGGAHRPMETGIIDADWIGDRDARCRAEPWRWPAVDGGVPPGNGRP